MIVILGEKYEYIQPYFLLKDGDFNLKKAVYKNGQLVWNIKNRQITYKQIKNESRNSKNKRAEMS